MPAGGALNAARGAGRHHGDSHDALFVTHPHYLDTMLTLLEINLRIQQSSSLQGTYSLAIFNLSAVSIAIPSRSDTRPVTTTVWVR